MQRDMANDLQSFFSLAYHGKSAQGQSPLPSDDRPVAFQQNELLVSVHVVHSCWCGQASSPRPGRKRAAWWLCNISSQITVTKKAQCLSVFLNFFSRGSAAPLRSATQMNSLMGSVNLLFLVVFARFLSSSPWTQGKLKNPGIEGFRF